jgi:hypothetical protein
MTLGERPHEFPFGLEDRPLFIEFLVDRKDVKMMIHIADPTLTTKGLFVYAPVLAAIV